MGNLYRGPPSIGASYQISIQLAKQFQSRRLFRNWPTRNKNCLWQPCLLNYGDGMSNLYRGFFIEVSVHLAKQCQRRRFKYEKITDDGRQLMAKAHMALRPGELKKDKGTNTDRQNIIQKTKLCPLVVAILDFQLTQIC